MKSQTAQLREVAEAIALLEGKPKKREAEEDVFHGFTDEYEAEERAWEWSRPRREEP